MLSIALPAWHVAVAVKASESVHATAGKALRDASTRGMDGIVSQEPTVARHAMALLVGLARHSGPQLLEQHKELASLVNGAAAAYESSGMVTLKSLQQVVGSTFTSTI